MVLVDGPGLVLPDVADRGEEGDIATVVNAAPGDVTHLLDEQVGRVELEAFGFLMPEIDIILGIRNYRQREGIVRGCNRRPARQ
jgi:hypothetical protein